MLYVKRNFHALLLFRDVFELGSDKACVFSIVTENWTFADILFRSRTTCDALVTVPGNVDFLVAGTSCVNYSNLNNEKQDIDTNGELGRTFRGMMG